MKTLTKSILVVLFFMWTMVYGLSIASADIPHLINYQGKLADNTGKPVTDGAYSVTFRIYDAESAGTLLWEETQSVSIQRGIFSVLLGGVTALNLAFDVPYWLEIKVGTEVMSPRQRMASVGYAFTAQNATLAQDATTIGTVGISATPVANKLLPLDSNAKIPSAVLPFKVYDSGWFAVGRSSSYSKTHNLGTTKLFVTLYGSIDGGITQFQIISWADGTADTNDGLTLYATTTTFTIYTSGQNVLTYWSSPGTCMKVGSGSVRIIAFALP